MEDNYQFGEYRVDPLDRSVRRNDVALALNRRAFDVLLYLVRNPGRVVAKEELLKNVWADAFVDENNLTQSISALRRALAERPGSNQYIATLPGRGYQFTMLVEVIPGASGSSVAVQGTPLEAGFDAAAPSPVSGAIFVQQRKTVTSTVTEAHSQAGAHGRRRGAIVAVSLVLLVAVVATGYRLWWRSHPGPTSATIVVAEFLNTTGDAAFDHTLHRALEIDLGQSPYLDVMSERAIVGELQMMGKPSDSLLKADLARQVCERNNRQAVLNGSIASIGSKYLLTLEATACATGDQIAAAKAVASSKEEVLASLDKVADRVRSKLGESSRSVASFRVPIAQVTTSSLDALKAFSMGHYLDEQGRDSNEALRAYQRAVELDPNFAIAYGEIATHYYNQNEYRLASEFYKKAFDLSGSVGVKEKLVIQAHYYAQGLGDRLLGIKTYQVWAATYPLDWTPWLNLANEYTQLGEYDEAIVAGKEALQRMQNGATYIVLARAYKRAGRFSEANAIGAEASQHGKASASMHALLYEVAVAQNDVSVIARETSWGESDGGWYFLDFEADSAARRGEYKRAQAFFERAYATAQRNGLPEAADNVLEDEVLVELMFGMKDAAKSTLDRIAPADRSSAEEAILHAETGDTGFAERYLSEHSKDSNSDTDMKYLQLPRLRATLALLRDKPAAAVADLEIAKPYDLAAYDILSLRGEADLKAGKAAAAAEQYQKILDNPGIDALSALIPLAHLGLARAYALGGNKADSRREYAAFLNAWKDADQGLAIVREAKTELAAFSLRG
jgi:DNA-binding winged helix-turn-helix (wHTH) protein/Tfp pilus assembly protein PilF